MPPYDDWNRIDDEDDEELQDASVRLPTCFSSWCLPCTQHLESKKDVILFCIDCSESMLELREDPIYENVQTCHAYVALEAAMQIQKKKVIVGPNDAVGILLFNTTRRAETSRNLGSEIKQNCFVYQPIAPLNAPKIQELIQLLDAFREDPEELKNNFPPLTGKRVAMGDVFTSCNWVLRDGAPKTASKRVFLITDEDDPHSGPGSKQLVTSSRTTLIDLTQSGVAVEPFFISTPEKPFDVSKFYSSVLLPNNLVDEDDIDADDPSVLPESISISRIEDLLAQMRFHEVPKRAQSSIPFALADGFTIGVKGYGLVTEQKKGAYKYFVDLGERMEVATVRTVYVDEDQQAEVNKTKIVYGMDVGAPAEEDDEASAGTRAVKPGQRPFFTAEDVRSFRTLGLEPGLKLLGFKDRSELMFEDNIKHSQFIYPDEMAYAGSKRTFSALLKSMVKKDKIGLVLSLTRRNASPTFCALLPQEERVDEGGWTDPAGFHLIPLPFADDIRAAPVESACRASDEAKDAAVAWISKLSVKNGSYPPDSYPNPALAFHNAQLQATAFGEEYDPDSFEDLTAPKVDMIHKRAGKLLENWKISVANDESAVTAAAPVETEKKGTKRKADVDLSEAEIRSRYTDGELKKLTVEQLKAFLKTKGLPYSGKKADLMDRVEEYLT
ncbi:Ku DNA-binding complex Ku70 subunit [Mycena sp. CBHHK59/15]|nr:Ku DNA-binding complex Ku70 subunit [Mycena sp. CBHHK59/15]